jgi:large-conductance mechanosensitive channel
MTTVVLKDNNTILFRKSTLNIMHRNYKTIKAIIIGLSIIFTILIIIFTIDVINEQPNWSWFNIDFNSSKVANYGALISGLLSFLAILYVIFGIAEQREQNENVEKEKNKEIIKNYESRLKLLKSLLIKITDEIKVQGKRMEKFYKEELENPTQPNVTHFSANKSFNRILEMDYLMNYQTIEYFFKEDQDWEKLFLNLNSYVDFYSETLLEHREKYQNHILDKVKAHKEISDLCLNFLDIGSKMMEKHKVDLGPEEYLNNRWVANFNDFVPAYYDYMDECKQNQTATNFRVLSNTFFLTFLEQAMQIRSVIGFDNFGSQDLVRLASTIRKKIYEVEMYSIQYAENVKYYFDEYFDENCKDFKNFTAITKEIETKLKQIDVTG